MCARGHGGRGVSILAGKTPALFTDLYQLTMAQAYWQSGVTGSATP